LGALSQDQHEHGLLDTSVVIGMRTLSAAALPGFARISAVTLAELTQGPHAAAADPVERAVRQEWLQWAEGAFDPLPFDVEAARAYGRVYAAVIAFGRQPRGRFADLQIAAVALSNGLPLYTRNPDDFRGLEKLVTVVAL
jgi:predicted nucleic acid-binding protein